MEEKLREFYVREFPEDTFGKEIDPNVTFEDLFEALDHYRDVYACIGVGDSIIRERLFSKLAKIMGVGYGYVYEQWLAA